eukprot:CAMPEP_0115742540 /NCGR_PEP_ID=MMETSP0272-20121206/90584_1 /TAXON_ID=71861 /ORGANISM="Scrippsiella trochoidea, Strain CCMP3099" /LENGTH=370 /DNA_ID=CAMNT_0003187273 /DNA_START=1 /DNA_END=1110 /DNA_ORIENTATION=+
MSTAAGIPDFRSPGGLYGTSSMLLDRFTYLEKATKPPEWQRSQLERDIKSALLYSVFSVNPLPYHEMRRGFMIGLGEGQWKLTLGHVFPEILNRNGKLHLLASQNIDGLDHKVVSDKSKLYNPHGLMSVLVSEPSCTRLCDSPESPIYQRYIELVKTNIKDIYTDLPARKGKSSHLWPGPEKSTPITLAMFGDLLPAELKTASEREVETGKFSVKPGSVLFDSYLWTHNAAGQRCDAMDEVDNCDLVLVMGTSLSGLSIDNVAHKAGYLNKPRLVFDMTRAPIESLERNGKWSAERDCHLQGNLDESVLNILLATQWLTLVFDYLPHLCLGSLKTLRQFVQDNVRGEPIGEYLAKIDGAIQQEVEREKHF